MHCPKYYQNFSWLEHSIQLSPCMSSKKRLAGVSFMHKLSVRNCTDSLLWSRAQVWNFPFPAVIFTWHTVITLKYQTPIFNFIISTASSVSAGQNTASHLTTNWIILAVFIHFLRTVTSAEEQPINCILNLCILATDIKLPGLAIHIKRERESLLIVF